MVISRVSKGRICPSHSGSASKRMKLLLFVRVRGVIGLIEDSHSELCSFDAFGMLGHNLPPFHIS